MEEDQKFYVTPNRILDAEIIGDVEYHPTGSPTGTRFVKVDAERDEPELRKKSELVIVFKDAERGSLTLYGDEADTAWKNFRLVAGPSAERFALSPLARLLERHKEKE
jgi:hypothetical protein